MRMRISGKQGVRTEGGHGGRQEGTPQSQRENVQSPGLPVSPSVLVSHSHGLSDVRQNNIHKQYVSIQSYNCPFTLSDAMST